MEGPKNCAKEILAPEWGQASKGLDRTETETGGCYDTVKRKLSAIEAAKRSQREKMEPAGAPSQKAQSQQSARGAIPEGKIPSRLDPRAIEDSWGNQARGILSRQKQEPKSETRRLAMPPPNLTGKLHLGHALDLSLLDIQLRNWASRGIPASMIAGLDHAGQSFHEKLMERRPDLSWESPESRERYEQAGEELASKMRQEILGQMSQLGLMADLSQPRMTADEAARGIAREAFETLKRKGRLMMIEGRLMLDLRPEARALRRMIQSGELRIEPEGHAARLERMLEQERLWEIGRAFPWGFSPGKEQGWEMALDTWFASALWPRIAGSGKAERWEALCIGYDISYFWGARMAMMAMSLGDPMPFKIMRLHGLIRDQEGRKFSKSLGNGIDPMEIIQTQGSDALRMWAAAEGGWGKDFKFNEARLKEQGRWLTKIANGCRLLELRAPRTSEEGGDGREIKLEGWIGEDGAERLDERLESWDFPGALAELKKIGSEELCEGWLGPRSKSWEADSKAWREDWGRMREFLAWAHPFAPKTTQWLHDRLEGIQMGQFDEAP